MTRVADAVAAVFGAAAPQARAYAHLLATTGIERGLIGPREAGRIWERHLFNCAAIAELIPEGERVVDLGSGAGLPGIVLAIRRPDLRVELVEPMQRRCAFLTEVLSVLGLARRVQVVRGRAQDPTVLRQVGGCGIVTARAVAPLERLAGWSLPLLRPDGTVLALKGERAEQEMLAADAGIRRIGGVPEGVRRCDAGSGLAPARVAVIRRAGGGAQRPDEGKGWV
ncbi:MAG: 16S rRNA (guanine(527)-N(7))-methyltransferase RsmG [Jatrophihabitans sp.]|nr:MAG: 16S rRNA (guanine(527)-N(7))-methyltransferase RsmG [Jatrophihabitans sp.]